jgi:predicted alpha/beta-hydrolase family hydrolase
MHERRSVGRKRPPARLERLEQEWLEVLSHFKSEPNIFIGGKSMGGRVAAGLRDCDGLAGIICLGYPLHAVGKLNAPDRIQRLQSSPYKTLILQGERDPMGTQKDFAEVNWPSNIFFHWFEDGDHSLKPRKSSGYSLEQHLETAGHVTKTFILETLKVLKPQS